MEVKSNDNKTFSDIYDKNFSVIMKVAYHITYSKDIAEDICQEAFIRFYDKAMLFPDENEALYWLIRVTKNLALNYVKKINREKAFIGKKKNLDSLKQESVFQTVVKEETRLIVKEAIDSLPEKLKTSIILREYGKLSYEQIGKVLQISESNAKIRVHRARKHLASLLNKEDVYVP